MGMFRDWEPEVQALLDVSRRSPAVLTGDPYPPDVIVRREAIAVGHSHRKAIEFFRFWKCCYSGRCCMFL